jgi:hypothetical protein
LGVLNARSFHSETGEAAAGESASTMHALYQRLKELDPNTFEKLVFHLLKERHLGIEIRHVEGGGGDQGIDSFSGDLDGDLVIWQAKGFANGVGKSQKEQIRKSLRQALKHWKPRQWILCVSVDLDTKAHRWFEKLAKSYASQLDIGLLDASQIVHELIHRRAIREAFFPHAILDTLELRQVLAKTGELTTDELATVTAENVDQYLERLKARDARITHQIVFSGNGQPSTPDTLPGLLASVSDGTKTIQVFARDTEALRLNPLKATFSIKGTGVQKFEEFIKTGKAQDLVAGELLTFSSDLSFLLPAEHHLAPESLQMHIGPSPTAERVRVPLRVTFGRSDTAVVFDYIEFRVARVGSEEIELVSTADLPFQMALIFGPPNLSRGKVDFTYTFAGADIRAIRKFMDAIDALRADGYVELYNLETGSRLTHGEMSGGMLEEWDTGFRRLVKDAVAVSEHYGVKLRYRKPEIADFHTLEQLVGLIEGLSLPAVDVTLQLKKITETDSGVYDAMRNAAAYRLLAPRLEPTPVLFGVPVPTGPVVWDMPEAIVEDLDEAYQRISRAAVGEGFAVKLILSAPVRVRAGGKRAAVSGDEENSLRHSP